MRTLVALVVFLWSMTSWGWNAVAHRIIAQIAYDHLSTHTKEVLRRSYRVFNRKHHDTFVTSAVWLDRISYRQEYSSWRPMHYIDLAFSDDHTACPPPQKINAVRALEDAYATLKNPHTSAVRKDVALRIVLHVTGDLHQPLHATTRVSQRWPDGDRGGNLVLLPHHPYARHLHAYWDCGGGLWCAKKHYSARAIKNIARTLEKTYPCLRKEHEPDPMHWAQESHNIAIRDVYHALPIDYAYQKNAQHISQQRIAQAGCRLADALNKFLQ